ILPWPVRRGGLPPCLQRLEIHCDEANTRSATVARRLGYALEARCHRYMRGVDGTLRDILIFVCFAKRQAKD
ncbi:MAG: GNAT family N-acetyltransferase, partial [Aggregatilineaceae bacterium]